MIFKLSTAIPPHFSDLTNSFLSDKYSHYWLAGGRGSCKSTLVSILIVLGILTNKDAHAICARRFKVDAHGSVYNQIIRAINILGVNSCFNVSTSTYGAPPIRVVGTGQTISFVGLDDPEGIKSIVPPSGYIKYSWFEELHQLKGLDKVRSALQTIRRGSDKKFVTFYSYNPPRAKNCWINEYSHKVGSLDDYYFSHSNYTMLPQNLQLKWLGKDWLKDAESLKSMDENAFTHEYLGVPTGYGTTVFKNVECRQITDDQISDFDNVIGGIDWGFAVDPFAYTRSHFDEKNKILYVFDEIFGVELFNDTVFNLMVDKGVEHEMVVADSAEPKSIAELQRLGIKRCIAAKKGSGSVESNTKFVQSLTKIIVDPVRCPNTWREFNNAEYYVDRLGVVHNRVSENNHSIDSILYRMSIENKRRYGWCH